jgi:glucan-binding YG repeat protein
MNNTTISHGFRAVIGGCNRRISLLLLILVVLVSSGVTGTGLRTRELGIGWVPTDSSSVDVTDAPVATSDEGMVDDSDELKSAKTKTKSTKLKSIKKKDDEPKKAAKAKKGIDMITKSEKRTKSKGDESTSNIDIEEAIDDGAIGDSSTESPFTFDPTSLDPTSVPTAHVVDLTVAPSLAPVASAADPTVAPVVPSTESPTKAPSTESPIKAPSTQSPTSTQYPTSRKSTKAATKENKSSFKKTKAPAEGV